MSNDQTAATASALRAAVGRSLGGVPFGFWSGTWSDPLDLLPGSLPGRPASASKRNTPLLEAAALDGIVSHAVLVSGQWPGRPRPARYAARKQPAPRRRSLRNPCGPPGVGGSAAARVARRRAHAQGRDRQRQDQLPDYGPFRAAQAAWHGRLILGTEHDPRERFRHPKRVHRLRPAAGQPGRLRARPSSTGTGTAGTLTARTGTWLAQPDMAKFTDTGLSAISGQVSALQQALLSSRVLTACNCLRACRRC